MLDYIYALLKISSMKYQC